MKEARASYFKVCPGFKNRIIKSAIERGDKAIVIEGYVCGTANTRDDIPEYSLIPALDYAREKGVPVFLTFGSYDKEICTPENPTYVTTEKMIRAGIVPLKVNNSNLLGALKSLEEILTQTDSYDEIIQKMKSLYPLPPEWYPEKDN